MGAAYPGWGWGEDNVTELCESLCAWLGELTCGGVFATDVALRVVFWNRWMVQHTGRAVADVIGQSLFELFPELGTRGLEHIYREALDGEARVLSHHLHRYLITVLAPQGNGSSPMRQSVWVTPLFEGNRVVGTVTLVYDVTDRVVREQALRESEQQLRAILHSIGDAVVATDGQGMISFLNPVAEELLGWQVAEVLGQPVEEVLKIEGGKLPAADAHCVRHVLRKGRPLRFLSHAWLETRSGNKVPVTCSCAPIIGAEGVPSGTITVLQDVSERVAAEETLKVYAETLEARVAERTRELAAMQERLLRQERLAALGQLAGSVAHELRHPLGVIANAAYLLQAACDSTDSVSGEAIREPVTLILEGVRMADKIVQDLLLQGRRAVVAERQLVDLEVLLNRVFRMLPPPAGVETEIQLPEDLPALLVDPVQIAQVVRNLVTNAYEAMPEGGKLTITARPDGDYVVLSVADTGVGIPEKDLPRLFQPLFTTKDQGIGLGLTTARRFVEANEGTMIVRSTPGKGTVFELTLPLAEAST